MPRKKKILYVETAIADSPRCNQHCMRKFQFHVDKQLYHKDPQRLELISLTYPTNYRQLRTKGNSTLAIQRIE